MALVPKHRGSSRVAHHIDWTFRPEAFMWSDDSLALRPNFYPYATELCKWMLRKECILPILYSDDVAFANPFTKHVSVLIAEFQRVSNGSALFVKGTEEDLNDIETELRRISLFSDFVLYATRSCEGLVKQLLYCSGFEPKLYLRSALGALLAQPCRACRKAGKEPHLLSLLGSLAHPYRLCAGYEKCLEGDLNNLNAMRNANAAHASTWEVRRISRQESWRLSHEQTIEAGDTLVHMLKHISDIEQGFWRDLTRFILQRFSTAAIGLR